MSQIDFTNTASSGIATPAAGTASIYIGTDKRIKVKDENARVSNDYDNYNVSTQSITAATRTYIVGSNVILGSQGLQVGSSFRWVFNIVKTGAGIAASTFDIAFGTLGTTGDLARVSFTKPAGTAAADTGKITIECVIRTIGATGVATGDFSMTHNLAATGHAVIPCVNVSTTSAGFDMTTVTNVGVCATTGTGDVITIPLVKTEAWDV
jgi:hypothetical protein